ncbi:valine--tRNA ligase [Mangrovibacterium diazotrophicum]|uniref:Valine--tRNA ligase n=1 Tax=Mangrovibacterium diazotrophicum TaxID=1261403 RepID=A0A419W891_9BACT|nr:valine--tRNA ligase [Mangrovibacterium diazotrophicum]RKD91679.1 valyl-tRNA synthetase [Mangrovibacterium diazotrophicum]
MEIPSKYNPAEVEDKWYKYWMDQRFFHSVPDEREPYTIVIPPPNVTGVLHMGHMLNNTIQDILTRRARMLGKNACWVPGTDHASIATEAKVVNKLKEQGISKTDLTREEFLEHAWEWTHKHGGIILEQLKKLGASCDWDRTCFTMDEKRSESVIKVFVDLYKKDLIYRGVRMVNWDPAAKTALSDEEVIYKEQSGKLYYLRYKVEGEDDYAVIATTRPETIFGDTAVCVNPNDEKTARFRGKKLIVPIVNRVVPVIEDDYVDMEFGTGCLKVTPAHDVNDYMLGEKYQLESIDIFNDNGTLNAHGLHYDGKDRFDVRKAIEQELIDKDLMEKTEAYNNKVGCSERTGVPIEPKLSTQWFLKMEDLAKPALSAVMDDIIKFVPEKFKNTYRHWMENIRDWNISRQLWWGHQIPAYYLPNGTFVVAETAEKALELAQAKQPELKLEDLRQDEDCLDTWFSSWLWPISVFDGINNPENNEIQYYYPTNDLVTGPDIIFFWVARMIVSGYEYRQEPCFKNVYFTGIVRDKLGRKMSKQLGNSPDPLDLIASYGADGVRVGMMLCSPAGGDLLFDESLPQQGAGFVTKMWNSFRLVKGWEVDNTIPQPEHSKIAIEWFRQKFSQIVEQTDDHFDKFRISDALMNAYTAVRDEFSGWLLELVKPAYQQPIDGKTYGELIDIFDEVLRFIHPFMPFVSEEIWQYLKERKEGESIMISSWPKSTGYDAAFLQKFEDAKEVISGIRNIRTKNNIANKDTLELAVLPGDKGYNADLNSVVSKLGNLSGYNEVSTEVGGAGSFLVKSSTYFVPLGELVDVEEELKKLEEELKYTKGFLKSVMGKLSNERFVAGAPEAVVAKERAKQADAEAKIKVLEEQIAKLK